MSVMVMKKKDIEYRQRLLERWGYQCVVCGLEFANLACVSKEHVIPKSKLHHVLGFPKSSKRLHQEMQKLVDNKAPSHYQCNKLRADRSLIEACREVERMQRKMSPSTFLAWLNKQIPDRIAPPEALAPLHGKRIQKFEEYSWVILPERLPGMR